MLKNIKNRNEYYPGIRGINLNDKFNDAEARNVNEKNIYENNLLDNNNRCEFMGDIEFNRCLGLYIFDLLFI